MRAPEFWYGAEGRDRAPMLQALAAPIAALYAAVGAAQRANARPQKLAIPVICVGNVSVGGVGKTPVARAIRAKLGAGAHLLLRGHGGRQKGPVQVDPAIHTARDVGDEPLLHARDGATWIARDRAAGARAAQAAGAQIIVLDDGFQNPSLAKDLSLLVFDARLGLGNARVVPAGPLREPVSRALPRADAAVIMGADPGARPHYLATFAGPVLTARLAATAPAPAGPLVAFAGIGAPEKFFDLLTHEGADLAAAIPFPDHHPFSAGDLRVLERLAQEREATLITTEKDAMRLPAAFAAKTATFTVEARFDDEAALDALLTRVRRG